MASLRPLRIERAFKSDCPALAKIYSNTIVPTQPTDSSKPSEQVEDDWCDYFKGLVECSAGAYPHDALMKAVRPTTEDSAEVVVGFALWWLRRRKGRGPNRDELVGVQRE